MLDFAVVFICCFRGVKMQESFLISEKQLQAIVALRGDLFKDSMVDAIAMVIVSGHTVSRAARLMKVDRSGLTRNIQKVKKWDEIIRQGYLIENNQ